MQVCMCIIFFSSLFSFASLFDDDEICVGLLAKLASQAQSVGAVQERPEQTAAPRRPF